VAFATEYPVTAHSEFRPIGEIPRTDSTFRMIADYQPAGDQPQAVAELERRIRAGEPWLHAHRTHIYQQWCDLGWSHQRVTALTAAGTLLLCLLGMVSLRAGIVIRAGADTAALGILAVYLRSSALIGRAGKAALLAERA